MSSQSLDYLNQFIGLIALQTCEMDEIPRPGDDGTPRRRLPGDRDPMASPELDQSLVSQLPRARRTVLAFTPRTLARSRAGGRRSPGPASPSAITRRMSAATCSWRRVGLPGSTWRPSIVLIILAPLIPLGRGVRRRDATMHPSTVATSESSPLVQTRRITPRAPCREPARGPGWSWSWPPPCSCTRHPSSGPRRFSR